MDVEQIDVAKISEVFAKKKHQEILAEIEYEKSELEKTLARIDNSWRERLNNETRDFEICLRSTIKKIKRPVFSKLFYWLAYDTWDVFSGLAILNNIEPRSLCFDENGNIYKNEDARNRKEKTKKRFVRASNYRADSIPHLRTLDDFRLSSRTLDTVFHEISNILTQFPRNTNIYQTRLLHSYYVTLDIWRSGNHTEDRYPVKYFIDWAIKKRIIPEWLDWAKENGLIDDDNKPEIEDREPARKSRTSFQNVMAALFNELLESKKKENPKITKTELICELAHNYSGYTGFSKSFLKQNITQGQQNLGYVEEK